MTLTIAVLLAAKSLTLIVILTRLNRWINEAQ